MQKTKECLFAEIEETLKQLNKSRVPETFIIEQAEIFRSGLPFQIAESAQVDVKNPDQKSILASPTHFNPVDLVCGVSEFQGECLDLRAFSNKSMGFITIKSKDGKELKALELPGLWNGGMDLWNTVFIEVPSSTFTPAKTVLDLLWPEHRPWATLVRRGRSCYVRKILHC